MFIKFINVGLRRFNLSYTVVPRYGTYKYSACLYCSEQQKDKDKPVRFSTSQASKWRAEYSRTGQAYKIPPAQPYIVIFSLAIFMLYFLVLREENDIDLKLGTNNTAFDAIKGLEEATLKAAIAYNESNNLDTAELQKRLDEIITK